jgi:hypothetical protein
LPLSVFCGGILFGFLSLLDRRALTLDLRVIGTTCSLDLVALLTAPLAFIFCDWEADSDHGRPTADPLALLGEEPHTRLRALQQIIAK